MLPGQCLLTQQREETMAFIWSNELALTPEGSLCFAYFIENNLSILRVSSCQEDFLLLLIDLIIARSEICVRTK